MATERVRVVVYMEPDTAHLVTETAEALGKSRSALVGQLVADAAPVLEVMRDAGLSLRVAPERQREVLASVAAAMRPMTDEMRRGLAEIERHGAEGRPPASNTGVRNA
jgi:uncharacterized protein (DUF1778 family)